MGETALDEETFRDYLTEMREHYTADKVSNSMHAVSFRTVFIIHGPVSPSRYNSIDSNGGLVTLMRAYIDFNCNSFTNDCIGFLTGGSIPPFIKGKGSHYLPVHKYVYSLSLQICLPIFFPHLWAQRSDPLLTACSDGLVLVTVLLVPLPNHPLPKLTRLPHPAPLPQANHTYLPLRRPVHRLRYPRHQSQVLLR